MERHKKSGRAQKVVSGDQQTPRLLDGTASTLSALSLSEKIQKRAESHGFDWDNIAPVFEKLYEEIDELKAEIVIEDNQERISDEMGDILFASVNLARHVGVNPEQALRDSSRKFIMRFEVVEQLIREDGEQMEDCSVAVLEDYWRKAKKINQRDTENAE
ncbi:MAG: MazG nucleotide pyrophosphohydrolase domain-containing protein [Methylococcales bacterium]